MKISMRIMVSAIAVTLVLLIPLATAAQQKHPSSGPKKAAMPGATGEMTQMMKSPHQMLMTAHMKSMSEFAEALRAQAMKPQALDVEFARAAVAELRHNLEAMEAIHEKRMQAMSAETKSKTQMMMEKMNKDPLTLNDQVSALETDVQGTPDNKQVLADTNTLLKHLGMMSKMNGGNKAAKRKMDMKRM
jgi:hypothetical protein